MDVKDILIEALQSEIDNADFSTEHGQDGSYQLAITKISEIFREYDDESLTLHDIVAVVNILDNLELTLLQAYESAIDYLRENQPQGDLD